MVDDDSYLYIVLLLPSN